MPPLSLSKETPAIVDTLKSSLEDSSAGRIGKYFTKSFLQDVLGSISKEIKSAKIQVDTDQEMLDYARTKDETRPETLERKTGFQEKQGLNIT